MKALIWPSGSAPMKPSAGWPLTKAITAGIDWMPIWPGMAGCSSMFILTSLTLPLAALTTFSRIGVSCLQGPHQGAQKSISTGWRFDSSMTSFMKPWVVVSLIRPSGAAAAAPATLSNIVMRSSPCARSAGPVPDQHRCLIKWAGEPANAIGSGRRAGVQVRARNPDDPGRMAGGFEEFHQVVAGDRGGHGVGERMRVDHGVLHQRRVE